MSRCCPRLPHSPLLYQRASSSTPIVGTCSVWSDIFRGGVWPRGGTYFVAPSQNPPLRVAPFPATLPRTGMGPRLTHCSTERSLVFNWLVRLRFYLSWALRCDSGGWVGMRTLDLVSAIRHCRILFAMKSSDGLRARDTVRHALMFSSMDILTPYLRRIRLTCMFSLIPPAGTWPLVL